MMSTFSTTSISRVRFYKQTEFLKIHSIERLMFGLRLNVLKYFEAFSFKCSSINHSCWYWVCSCYFPFAQTNRKYKPTGSTNQPEAQTNRKYKPTGSSNQPEVQTNSIERLMFGLRLNVLKYFEAFSFKCSSINHNCWYWVCSCYFSFAQTNRKYKPTGSTNQPEVQTNRKHKPIGSTNQPEAQICFIELAATLTCKKVT